MIEEIVFGTVNSTGVVLLMWTLGSLFMAVFVYASWTQSLKSRNGPVSESSKKIAWWAGCLFALPVLLVGYYMSFASFHTVTWTDEVLEMHYTVPPRTKSIPWSEIQDIEPYLTGRKADHRKHALVYSRDGDSYYSFAGEPAKVQELQQIWREKIQDKP